MIPDLINVQYCYQYLVEQISLGLLLYSHIPVALTAFIFSIYVLIKSKSLPSILLFATCLTFTLWCIFDLSAWFAFLGSANTMFVWSLLDFLAVVMFCFGYYFLYTFITEKDLPFWQKIVGFVIILPTAYITLSNLNIPIYDLNSCAALEDGSFTIYTYYTEAFIILSSLVLIFFTYRSTKDKNDKSKILLAGTGVVIFLSFFFSASFLVSRLAATDLSLYVYNYLIYGLFGMPIFLIYLGYLIVHYKAFDLRIFTAQALSISIVTLVATQYAFLSGMSSIVLNSINLILVTIVSVYLTRNVKREISLREDLEIANSGQKNLIHIMNHQIKGYMTIDRNIFAELLTDDYGKIPKTAKEIIQKGLSSADQGTAYVIDILRGAAAESGEIAFEANDLDFKKVVLAKIESLKERIEKKGIELCIDIKEADYHLKGDEVQLGEAIRNLIENSLNYTMKGSINIDINKTKDSIIFSIRDTGVGIKEEDKHKIFKAGGVASDSIKVNVNSSGYGLAFVKGVIEKHKGKVWFWSAGKNKGSTFYVELPIK